MTIETHTYNMTNNPFTYEASRLRFLAMRQDRANVFATFCDCCQGIERNEHAALWWGATAVIAEYLAYDEGLADIAATLSRNRESHLDQQAFFLAVARLAQAHDETPTSAEALLQHGLLPTTCRLSAFDFRRLAARVLSALHNNDTAGAGAAMRTLAEFCSFTPDTLLPTTAKPHSAP